MVTAWQRIPYHLSLADIDWWQHLVRSTDSSSSGSGSGSGGGRGASERMTAKPFLLTPCI